jgi:hypothetical protein
MSVSAIPLSPPLDDDASHGIRVGRGDKLNRDVATAGKITMEKTFRRTAVLGADVSAMGFLLHVNLRSTGPDQDTFVTSAA